MDNTIDYAQMWKTLLRTGIKERFIQIRREFFMNVAADGPRSYTGLDTLEEILKSSPLSGRRESWVPDIREYALAAIKEDDSFKHYYYQTADNTFFVEYFANKSRCITKELLEKVNMENVYGEIDGFCYSMTSLGVDGQEDTLDSKPTYHFILLTEIDMVPEFYPKIIKHELTHACIYEIRNLIHNGIVQTRGIPATWSDEDRESWCDDINTLYDILKGDTKEKQDFIEFICEFLMFESDGQTKVKNPVIEAGSKSTKPDSKPKITYRTMTPYDRFVDVIDSYGDDYREAYETIISSLAPFYENYDKFLDDVRL